MSNNMIQQITGRDNLDGTLIAQAHKRCNKTIEIPDIKSSPL
jgi:hypothetical protein